MSLALLLTVSVAADEPRGGIAFHYATPLSPRELEWYGRFDVLVTHDPLPRPQVDALHRQGTKVALYEWAVAYYAALAIPWQRSAPVLNRTPLRGHLGATDADAFYFDPATREHGRGRAELLARRLRAIGYDGVFLDTTTSASVHPDALAEYQRRHPEVSYDEAFAQFLSNLSKSVEVIVTNQGYRAAKHILPYADWDVSESLITRPLDGRFVFRPWNDPKDRWNSTAYLMKELIGPVQRAYPQVRFAHINYIDAVERERVADLVAISRLYDAEAVIARPDLAQMIESDLLLHDLGMPRTRVDRENGAYRFYSDGFIAYNAGSKAMRVANRDGLRYTDVVNGKTERGKMFVIPAGSSLILRRGTARNAAIDRKKPPGAAEGGGKSIGPAFRPGTASLCQVSPRSGRQKSAFARFSAVARYAGSKIHPRDTRPKGRAYSSFAAYGSNDLAIGKELLRRRAR
ncbi:MAG TPA: hypothetical protein VEK57_16900 [Thermoanaerobaculia bacterium]|nr:hypothetical protein [Thermoanaerobaculia bacterium]